MFGVSEYWVAKYERDAKKNWDLFYKRNQTRAYNDRHWITNDEIDDGFGDLLRPHTGPKKLLEVGCGVGNTLTPLLAENSSLFFHAFDFSSRAIQLLTASDSFNAAQCNAFVHDIATQDVPDTTVQPGSVDVALLLFVLSAIDPQKHLQVLQRIRRTLRPGGLLLFRDFEQGDLAEERFKRSSQIDHHYFVRQDGTRSFFFEHQAFTDTVQRAGFEVVQLRSVQREIRNRRQDATISRRWLQGKIRSV